MVADVLLRPRAARPRHEPLRYQCEHVARVARLKRLHNMAQSGWVDATMGECARLGDKRALAISGCPELQGPGCDASGSSINIECKHISKRRVWPINASQNQALHTMRDAGRLPSPGHCARHVHKAAQRGSRAKATAQRRAYSTPSDERSLGPPPMGIGVNRWNRRACEPQAGRRRCARSTAGRCGPPTAAQRREQPRRDLQRQEHRRQRPRSRCIKRRPDESRKEGTHDVVAQ